MSQENIKTEQSRESTNQHESSLPIVDVRNQKLFSKMSEKAQGFFHEAYEKTKYAVKTNRSISKMEVAYNQFWINKKEEKSVRLKNKVDSINIRSNSFDNSISEMKSLAESLKLEGVPGADSLRLKMSELEQQKSKLAKKKDRLQSRIEKRDNQISLYTNKRDSIASRMISKYEKNLSPLENNLSRLNDRREELELVSISSEIRHGEILAKIKILEGRKSSLEDSLSRSGISDRKINKLGAIKEINKIINEYHMRMQAEKDSIDKRKQEIDSRIAKVDKKANPYRDRRDEFARIKDNRPVRIDLDPRVRVAEFVEEERISSHPRPNSVDSNKNSDYYSSPISHEGSVNREGELNFKFGQMLDGLNAYIDAHNENQFLRIDKRRLFKMTYLSEQTNITAENFKKVIGQYYKVNKIQESLYSRILKDFLKI